MTGSSVDSARTPAAQRYFELTRELDAAFRDRSEVRIDEIRRAMAEHLQTCSDAEFLTIQRQVLRGPEAARVLEIERRTHERMGKLTPGLFERTANSIDRNAGSVTTMTRGATQMILGPVLGLFVGAGRAIKSAFSS